MNTRYTVLDELVALCREHAIFPTDALDSLVDADLLEQGVVDSLSLTLLVSAIEETYSVAIPIEILIGELRSLNSVADYIEANTTREMAA